MKKEDKMKVKETLNNVMSSLAEDMLEEAGSMFFWGEIQVPECLKKEVEMNSEVME